jgi:S1-C subfamily serine protease
MTPANPAPGGGDGLDQRAPSPPATTWPWWVAVGLLLLLCLGLGAYLALREPARVENLVETPVAVETTADQDRLNRLNEVIAVRREQLGRSVTGVEAPRCEAPAVLDPDRLSALRGGMDGDLERWRALLAQSAATEAGQEPLSAPETPKPPDPTPSSRTNGPEGAAHPFPIGVLREKLEQGTVLVLALPPTGVEGLSTGTGFFIAKDLLVTNLHVIEPGDPESLFVTSASLGRLTPAKLVAQTRSSDPGEPDFALLRIEGVLAPAPLALASETAKLSPVIAAGFPGMSLLQDSGFQALLSGDLSSAPDLNMNRGEIRSVRSLGATTQIIHTADVLKGYSGGPLLDSCGRAIGVNTLIQVDQDQAAKLNAAQTVETLRAFLERNGVSAPVDTRPCDISGQP